jgi:hypothetical protein
MSVYMLWAIMPSNLEGEDLADWQAQVRFGEFCRINPVPRNISDYAQFACVCPQCQYWRLVEAYEAYAEINGLWVNYP